MSIYYIIIAYFCFIYSTYMHIHINYIINIIAYIYTLYHTITIYIGIYRYIYIYIINICIHNKALYFVTWMTWISLFQVAQKRPWRTPWNSSACVFCPPSVSASRSGKRRRACKTPRSGRSKSLWMLGSNSWWDIDDLGCLILMMDKFCWFRVRESLML